MGASEVTKKEKIGAHCALVFTQTMGVIMYIFGKHALGSIPFFTFIVARITIAAVPMLIASFVTARSFPAKKFIPWLMLSGFTGIFLQQSLLFYGLSKSTATNAAVITTPSTLIFTNLLSIIKGSDKMTINKAVGMVLCISGALVLSRIEEFSFEGKALGNIFLFGASICSAFQTIIQRRILDNGLHPISTITYPTLFGGVMVLLVFVPFGSIHPRSWDAPASAWGAIVFTGLISTALAWCLNSWALQKTSPGIVSLYPILQPMLSTMAGTLILHEAFSLRDGLSCAVIVVGMVCVNWNAALKNSLKAIIMGKPKAEGFEEVATEENAENASEMDGHVIELETIEGKPEIEKNVA